MKIAMFTNTFTPHVGGVAESVKRLTEDCRNAGHDVCVIAPEFADMPENEHDVVRVPAIQNFNGSDFSVSLPAPLTLSHELDRFAPEIIHTHHPYLLGDTALRVSARRNLPLVFTYHTMYEDYTHYVPVDSPQLKRFVIELATGYANLCDHLIAPSESIAVILQERGVHTPITVVPTGVDCDQFASGDGVRARQQANIPEDAFVIGHVGRLAEEKNLLFLAKAVALFLQQASHAYFLIVGEGSCIQELETIFEQAGVRDQIYFAGVQKAPELMDYYHAMDLFVFASKTETQGMVLAEAMSAGAPVIALDAPGAREIVQDGKNGRLLSTEDVEVFAETLAEAAALSQQEIKKWQQAALKTAQRFSRAVSLKKILALYEEVLTVTHKSRGLEDDTWETLGRAVKQEWEIWSNRLSAGLQALSEEED
ncbi:MAG: glycosyltransferase [Candidatus Vecturithrix sp.]|jgi:glycosyltransferase involved in cell wall biosynthesis|nr:glycosyltransferase [Candidatus Vecturithrix sp.]